MFGGESKIEIMLITWLCRRKVLRVVKGGHHWCRFGVQCGRIVLMRCCVQLGRVM